MTLESAGDVRALAMVDPDGSALAEISGRLEGAVFNPST
jgi:hypothetical protein